MKENRVYELVLAESQPDGTQEVVLREKTTGDYLTGRLAPAKGEPPVDQKVMVPQHLSASLEHWYRQAGAGGNGHVTPRMMRFWLLRWIQQFKLGGEVNALEAWREVAAQASRGGRLDHLAMHQLRETFDAAWTWLKRELAVAEPQPENRLAVPDSERFRKEQAEQLAELRQDHSDRPRTTSGYAEIQMALLSWIETEELYGSTITAADAWSEASTQVSGWFDARNTEAYRHWLGDFWNAWEWLEIFMDEFTGE